MAEENQSQDKTEEPSARKLEKAREDGQVARSRELNSMAMLLAGSVALLVFGADATERLAHLTTRLAGIAANGDDRMFEALQLATTEGVALALPILVVVFVAAVVSSGAMGGFVLSSRAIAFKGSRLSPLAGLTRMFSLRALVELAKAIAKVVVVAGVSVVTLNAVSDDLLNLGLQPLEGAMKGALDIVGFCLIWLAGSLVVVAAVDVPFQLAEFRKELKMTRRELQDEMKESEGRPEVKSRIRRMQQELARRRMFADVPKADVVITNPEHYSVALQYDAATMGAPVVLAKGADLIALKIREIANANSVAVIEAAPLARAIFYSTDVGGEVPAPLYVAVAQVLAYIYQLAQHRKGTGAVPRPLPALDIPADYRRDA